MIMVDVKEKIVRRRDAPAGGSPPAAEQALLGLDGPIPAGSEHPTQFADLQGNVLKSHGRNFAAHIFLTFKAGKKSEARAWKNSLKERLTTTQEQFDAAKQFRETGQDGGMVMFCLLSGPGYAYFDKGGIKEKSAAFKVFHGGMDHTALGDKPEHLDPNFPEHCHMLIIAADIRSTVVESVAEEIALETSGFAEVFSIIGRQRRNARGAAIEHFGYLDGRSQPLFFEDEIAQEIDGTSLWDPRTAPAQVLVKDPFGKDDLSLGSFLVFRQLEENVKAFKQAEQSLANALNLLGDERELAGALVVGRFEDGTPVMLSKEAFTDRAPISEGEEKEAANNFNYDTDFDGRRCPVQAHIRKTNPRGSVQAGAAPVQPGETTVQFSKKVQMARRGITYGERGPEEEPFPEGDVGLLFMAYQADIGRQFEIMQRAWANNPNFPRLAPQPGQPSVGIDLVIGQGASSAAKWPKTWGKPPTVLADFAAGFSQFVTTKGGGYFFQPSLSGLVAI
jgi:Dyp-type peroxidase family